MRERSVKEVKGKYIQIQGDTKKAKCGGKKNCDFACVCEVFVFFYQADQCGWFPFPFAVYKSACLF